MRGRTVKRGGPPYRTAGSVAPYAKQLHVNATAIAALMQRLGMDEVALGEAEIHGAEGVVDIDVTRNDAGDLVLLLVRFTPDDPSRRTLRDRLAIAERERDEAKDVLATALAHLMNGNAVQYARQDLSRLCGIAAARIVELRDERVARGADPRTGEEP